MIATATGKWPGPGRPALIGGETARQIRAESGTMNEPKAETYGLDEMLLPRTNERIYVLHLSHHSAVSASMDRILVLMT